MHDRIATLRRHLYEVIFQSSTPADRKFDIGLLCCIQASSTVVIMVDSLLEITLISYDTVDA